MPVAPARCASHLTPCGGRHLCLCTINPGIAVRKHDAAFVVPRDPGATPASLRDALVLDMRQRSFDHWHLIRVHERTRDATSVHVPHAAKNRMLPAWDEVPAIGMAIQRSLFEDQDAVCERRNERAWKWSS